MNRLARCCAGVFAGMMLCGLSGCLLGPDYQRPDVPALPEWSGANAVSSAKLVGWWNHLGEPLLTNLVEQAFAVNHDARQAVQRIRQSRAVLKQAGSDLWPALDGSGGYTRQKQWGDDVTKQSWNGLYTVGLDASWELDIFGGTRREIEAAEADFFATLADARDVYVTLAAEVATTYTEVRKQQELLRVTEDNLETQARSAGITRARYQNGFVSGLDVANAEGQLASTRSQIPTIRANLKSAVLALETLLGELPGALEETLRGGRRFLPLPEDLPSGMPSELLERRPDIQRAEAELHAATARIGAAKADLFPKFNITAGAGVSAAHLDSWSAATRSLSIFPGVSWSLFNAGKLSARVEERHAYAEQMLIAYQKTVLQAFSEVEDTWQSYAHERERTVPLMRSVDEYRRAVKIASELYHAGEVDYVEVLVAQQALLSIEESAATHHAAMVQKLIALYKALGGGWETVLE